MSQSDFDFSDVEGDDYSELDLVMEVMARFYPGSLL